MYFESTFDPDICKYKKENKWLKHELNTFHSLPEQAQNIYLTYFYDLDFNRKKDEVIFDDMLFFKDILCTIPGEVNICQSPIEKTLFCAIHFIGNLKYHGILSHGYYIKPQYEIKTDKQKRIMDFAVIDEDDENQNIVVFIECDGFDYHAKTKEQFTYTQQKDRELKTMGYDVLHFTGTEINSNPLKCADEVWKFIEKKDENNGDIQTDIFDFLE